jgi:hypothetical protein
MVSAGLEDSAAVDAPPVGEAHHRQVAVRLDSNLRLSNVASSSNSQPENLAERIVFGAAASEDQALVEFAQQWAYWR